jgi:hypothetical protein
MKFPVKVTFRKAEAKIYGKSAAYPFYRLCYYAAGKRRIQSFSTYAAAKTAADAKVQEIAKGNQSIALTPKEATAALSIRDALDTFRRDTGRSYTALEAVTGFLNVVKQLPEGCNPTEAARAYSRTLATIRPKLISKAVEEFNAVRKPKAQAADGKRAQLSPVYALHIETWLEEFAATFPGHHLGDLNRDFLAKYIGEYATLSPKSRNDRRAAMAMFLRWCARIVIGRTSQPKDYLLAKTSVIMDGELDVSRTEIGGDAHGLCGPNQSILVSGRATPSLRQGWTN